MYIFKEKSNNNNKLNLREDYYMKFVKGMVIGGLISAGAYMLYMESSTKTKKMVMKKGKQALKRMGIM